LPSGSGICALTLSGQPATPTKPYFGAYGPNVIADFEGLPVGAKSATHVVATDFGFSANAGSVQTLMDGPGGTANQAFVLTGPSGADNRLILVSDEVDLRSVIGSKQVSIDVRTFESGVSSDFDVYDFIHVVGQYSLDGTTFQDFDVVPLRTGGQGIGDPADLLKALDTGPFGPYTSFSAVIPEDALTARLVIDARNDGSERFIFDNVAITVVPEPGTLSLAVLLTAGFAFTRRRFAG
jgi:hypothetical protein